MDSYTTNYQALLPAAEDAQHLSQKCKNGRDTLTAHWRQDHCLDCLALVGEMRSAVNESKAITKQAGILIHTSKPLEHVDEWWQLRERWKDAHLKWVLAAANLRNHFATKSGHAHLSQGRVRVSA
jgi:hypothetical protein